MKLKLLLCYVLVASAVCFAVTPDVADEEEDDETVDIVSDPLAAMGRAPRAVAKKVSQNMVTMGGSVGADPYATAKKSTHQEVPAGDPYAKTMVKVDLPVSDPYASLGASPVSQAVPKKVKKSEKSKTATSLSVAAQGKIVAKLATTPKEKVTLASALFKSTGSNDPEAQAAVLEIERQVKNQENQLHLVAKQNLVDVTQAISEQAAQLREEADNAAQALRAKTENQVQELIDTAGKQIDNLNKKISQKAVELKQEAAQKALLVLDDIEARAAKKRLEERKRTLAATFGITEEDFAVKTKKEKVVATKKSSKKDEKSTQEPLKMAAVSVGPAPSDAKASPALTEGAVVPNVLRVSAEWKNDLSRRFYQDMATMKDIIVEAESPLEAQDFLKKFEEQNKWFDANLRSTRAVTDAQYAQLVEKQAQMGRIMQAQRVADDYLQKFTKNMVMDHLQLKKIRLNVLYELNTRTQQRSSHLDRAVRESALPDDEVKSLVKRTLSETSQQFREIAAQFPDVEIGGMARKPQLSLTAVPLAAQQLEVELNKTKELAAAIQKELEDAKQELVAAREIAVQTQAALDRERDEKDQVIKDAARIKTTAIQVLDKQAQDNLNTDLVLAGVRQDQSALKDELKLVGEKSMQLVQQKRQLTASVEIARKEAMQADLLRNDYITESQKTMRVMKRQTKEQMKSMAESGARRELALIADLRQANEKIGALNVKHAKLMQDLELQYKKTVELKNSLKMAQETANRAESRADLANRSLAESDEHVKRQLLLRKQTLERVKKSAAVAQQTIDSIGAFLQIERKSGNKKLITSTQDLGLRMNLLHNKLF